MFSFIIEGHATLLLSSCVQPGRFAPCNGGFQPSHKKTGGGGRCIPAESSCQEQLKKFYWGALVTFSAAAGGARLPEVAGFFCAAVGGAEGCGDLAAGCEWEFRVEVLAGAAT